MSNRVLDALIGVPIGVLFFVIGLVHFKNPERPWFQGGVWRPSPAAAQLTALFWMMMSGALIISVLAHL